MIGISALLRRDLRLALRDGIGPWTVLGFFVIAVAVFPLGIGPEPQLLARIAPGIIWAMALLSALLSFDSVFEADYRDGSLDLLLSGRTPTELLVLTKALAHWLTTGVPLVCLAPVLAVLLHLPAEATLTLVMSLLLGTPILSLLGIVGAAISLGARHGTVLLAIMVLPLAAPVLIFGSGAVEMTMTGLASDASLLILGGVSLGAVVVCPIAAAAALRQAVE
jgi:heme exporter protein B